MKKQEYMLKVIIYNRSRLGCQVFMNKDLDDITVRIPSATRNLRVDGKVEHLLTRQVVI